MATSLHCVLPMRIAICVFHRLDLLGDYERLVIGIVQLIPTVGDEIVVVHWR